MNKLFVLFFLSSVVFAQPPLAQQEEYGDAEVIESVGTMKEKIAASIAEGNFTEAEGLIRETITMARDAGLTDDVVALNIQLAVLPQTRQAYEFQQGAMRMAAAAALLSFHPRGPLDLSHF